MDIRSFLVRFLERPRVLVARAVLDTYGRAAGGLLASGLAFSALFAAIPATLLAIGLAGWVASGDPTIQTQVSDALTAAFPPLAGLIRSSVEAIADGAALTSLVGVVGLVWTVSQLFGAIDTAFARIFAGVPERDLLRRTVLGFGGVALVGAVIVMAVAALGALAALDALSDGGGTLAGGMIRLMTSPPSLAFAACAAVAIGYRRFPPQAPTWRVVLVPAVVVGLLLTVFSQAFSFLVPRLIGVAALAGPLASGFAALAWLSLSFQAFLLGAAWVRVRVERSAARDEARPSGSAALERPAPPAEPGSRGE